MNAQDTGDRSASFSEGEGLLVVHDRSLFRPGFEGFCRRLAESSVGLGGVRSAFVCLASGTCRLEFEAGKFAAPEMAEWFAEAVRIAASRGHEADQPGGWVSLRVESVAEGGTTWETTVEGRGAFRLRTDGLVGRRDLAHQVADELADLPGVDACWVSFWGGDLELRYTREGVCASEALAVASGAMHRASASLPVEGIEAVPEVATGLERVGYLAAAAGSFGLTIVGLAIPGVPTVPFLLATSYFLVRSSPALNEKLLHSKFFGPILSDLEFGHGLQRINRIKLIGFSLAVPLLTLLLIAPTWPILVVMLTLTSAGLFAITRIPAITDQSEPAPASGLTLQMA